MAIWESYKIVCVCVYVCFDWMNSFFVFFSSCFFWVQLDFLGGADGVAGPPPMGIVTKGPNGNLEPKNESPE